MDLLHSRSAWLKTLVLTVGAAGTLLGGLLTDRRLAEAEPGDSSFVVASDPTRDLIYRSRGKGLVLPPAPAPTGGPAGVASSNAL